MDSNESLDSWLAPFFGKLEPIDNKAAADFLGISEKTLRRRRNDAKNPLRFTGRGTNGDPYLYDPVDIIRHALDKRIAPLLPQAPIEGSGDDDGRPVDIDREAALKLRAERQLTEERRLITKLERQQKANALVEIELVERLFSSIFSMLKEGLMGLSGKIVNEAIETRDVALGTALFESEMSRVLNEAAERISEIDSLEES